MKKVEDIKPNYAAVYAAALYPDLCKIFQSHGYALAAHGSLARDFDLIAVPWIEKVSEPADVVKEIMTRFWIQQIGEYEVKVHGRLVYTISVGHGECAIDLSFL